MGPADTPPAIWFTRLLLLVQGTILASGAALALADAGRGGIKEVDIVVAVIAGIPACACLLIGICLRRGRRCMAGAAIAVEGLWIIFTGLLGMWPSGAMGVYGPPDLILGIASVTAFTGLLRPRARRFGAPARAR